MRDGQKRTGARKQKEQEERKKTILNAAREAFFEKGFMAATMDGIAEACDLAKGTLYLYFRSKEELYFSVLAEGLSLLKQDFDRIPGLLLPADLLLEEVLKTYYGFYERNPRYFRIVFLSSLPDFRERTPDELLKKCVDEGRKCLQVVSDIIAKGIESGIFRNVDAWAAANILWSTVNGIVMNYEQGPLHRNEILKLPLQEMLYEALDLAVNGLRSGKRQRPRRRSAGSDSKT
jgi:AcrR family transcriptional regulator